MTADHDERAGPNAARERPDWSLIKLRVLCPRCDYDLRGLTEARCPECGLRFEWDGVLERAAGSLDHVLFERQWRTRPLRSFVGTVARTLVPWRFWPGLARSSRPSVLPLGVLLLLVWLVYLAQSWVRDFAGHEVGQHLFELRFGPMGGPSVPFEWYPTGYVYEGATALSALFLVWLSAQFCSQMLAKKHIARQSELIRLIVFAIVPAAVIWAGLLWLKRIAELLSFWHDPAGGVLIFRIGQYAGRCAIAFFVISFCMGASAYLRLRLGWLWGLIVVSLAATVLWIIVFDTSVGYYGTFDSPWLGILDFWWPGAKRFAGEVFSSL